VATKTMTGLLTDATTAAIDKAAPNYMPLARQANSRVIDFKEEDLPADPHEGLFGKDASAH
jgi:hypothetical protein